MKTIISIFSFCFFLISCSVESPHLIITGIQTEEALSFLEKYQKREKNDEQFEKYLQQLRVNYTPKFNWSQYWSAIGKRRLYNSIAPDKLDQLLSLSNVSCQNKDWISFSNLLLQIGEEDKENLLFSKHLVYTKTCPIWISNTTLKSIVNFLSEKRAEEEISKIAKEKSVYRRNRGEDISLPEGQKDKTQKEKYIYTEELQNLLLDEWFKKHAGRNWGNILEALDQNFWSDARWINYRNENRESLQSLLEMEWHIYKSIKPGISLDVLLMFDVDDEMESIIELAGYKKYFSAPGVLDWSALWTGMLWKYSAKPKNGNVDVLLSLYNYFPCDGNDLSHYIELVKQWGVHSYEELATAFCQNLRRKRLLYAYPEEMVEGIFKQVHEGYIEQAKAEVGQEEDQAIQALYEAMEKAKRAGFKALYEVILEQKKSAFKALDEALNVSSSRAVKFLGTSVFVGGLGLRSMEEVVAVLSVYKTEQFKHDREDWRYLLDKHFSKQDWLNTMRILRVKRDKSTLSMILDMHDYIYEGKNYWLGHDIYAILQSRKIALSEIEQYGYEEKYVNTPDVRSSFWGNAAKYIYNTADSKIFSWKTAFKQSINTCAYSNVVALFYFFSEMNQEEILFDQFRFKDCADFIREFREKEWNRLNEIVSRDPDRWSLDPSFIWWLARVFYLYSEEEDSLVGEKVSEISELEWNYVITGMLHSYTYENFEVDNDLFENTLYKVRQIYNKEVESILCSFFFLAGDYSFVERHSQWLMNLLHGLSWSKQQDDENGRSCAEIIPTDKRNTLLVKLLETLFLNSRKTSSFKDSISSVWSVSVQILVLSLKVNDWKGDDVKAFKGFLYDQNEEGDNSDFYIWFSNETLYRLLKAADGNKELLLTHLTEDVWKKPPIAESLLKENPSVSVYIETYKDWLREKINNQSSYFFPVLDDERYAFSTLFNKEERAVIPGVKRVNFVSYEHNEAEATVFRDQEEENSPLDSGSDYGKVFIEETSSPDNFDYKISVSSGVEIGSPYISSYFIGLELQREIYPLVYLGLSYSFHESRATSTTKGLKNISDGIGVSYSFLRHMVYLNGHYHLFKSHLNLAGFFKAKLNFPFQVGAGLMNREQRGTDISLKWGIGPHLQFNPRWGVQLFFHQTVSTKKFSFLYTWASLVMTFSF